MNSAKNRKRVAVIVDAASYYGRAVARGAMQFANQNRRWVVSADFRQGNAPVPLVPECEGAVVAGVSAARLAALVQRIPHVVSCSPGTEALPLPVVTADSEACGALAAEHLVECRLKHFAYCGWADDGASQQRLAGYERALRARGFGCAVFSPAGGEGERGSAEQVMGTAHRAGIVEWLKSLPQPVGVLAYDDWVAYALAAICQQEGMPVPQHIAIVGINNDDLLCPTAWPPLSSVEIDFHQVGYFAARQLDRLLAGETLTLEERLLRVLPVGVVRRQSTDLLAVRDRHVAAAVRFIRKHACDPCSIDDILQHVPVGRRWLERKFVEVLDRTLFDELQHVRLETAQRLLLETDEKVERVAEASGFSNARSFIRAFNRALGTTPAAFRRAHFADVGGRELK
jgi:LacI family transcriptional regulator